MAQKTIDDVAVNATREVQDLVKQASGKIDQARQALGDNPSPTTTALLGSLSRHLREVALIADFENDQGLSRYVVSRGTRY